jgi:hypothetical protein
VISLSGARGMASNRFYSRSLAIAHRHDGARVGPLARRFPNLTARIMIVRESTRAQIGG